ncbi:MAG: proteasome assembly chaperone 4 family protein [Candidatus Bathyarchaeia archaeon]
MERAKIVKDQMVEQNVHFLAVYLETKNSCLVLLSEKEDRLGTLAIAVPKPADSPGLPSSTVILGDRNIISTRMLAEYLASRKKKIALVSIYLETIGEVHAQTIFKKLLEKVISAEAEKGESLA